MICKIHKLRFLPAIVGAMMYVFGFYFLVFKAGLPYQDPTPAMQMEYNFYSQLGESLMKNGSIIFGVGIILIGVYKIIITLKKEDIKEHFNGL